MLLHHNRWLRLWHSTIHRLAIRGLHHHRRGLHHHGRWLHHHGRWLHHHRWRLHHHRRRLHQHWGRLHQCWWLHMNRAWHCLIDSILLCMHIKLATCLLILILFVRPFKTILDSIFFTPGRSEAASALANCLSNFPSLFSLLDAPCANKIEHCQKYNDCDDYTNNWS